MYQKFCGHLYTGRRRNSVSTLTLDIAEICDHSYTGFGRNSATFYTMDVAEILQRFIHWVLQKFCDQSYTGCCRNSAITQTLSLAENLRLFIHWMSQKFCNHSQTGCKRDSEKKYYFVLPFGWSAFQPKGRTKLAFLRYNLTDRKTIQSYKLNYFIKQRVILLTKNVSWKQHNTHPW